MLCIRLKNDQQGDELKHGDGVLEIGRSPGGGSNRMIAKDEYVSRDQLRIEELPGNRVRLENIGGPIRMADGSMLSKGDARETELPVQMVVGYTNIEIAAGGADSDWQASLQTISRPRSGSRRGPVHASLAALALAPSTETLAQWFETLLSVQRAAAGSDEFYQQTASAVVELVGLDRGLVLLRRAGDWHVVASHVLVDDLGAEFSRRVLAEVVQQQRSFYQGVEDMEQSQSLLNVEAVVAAPVFDGEDNVIGAVYGSRDLRQSGRSRGIQSLEAQLVQLLAGAVSTGLARVEQEAEAGRMRVQFESFCSPELVRELERNPALLEGHEREITLLFCDMRGFSRISERLGPKQTYAMLSDLLDRLTGCIVERQGVIVDYAGDGLAAMWNAPTDQPDHAALACRAALGMLAQVPALNERWAETAGRAVQIGVGINTGIGTVGNAGSRRRLKYGPRGHVVNLASRVEGATKHLGVSVLLTAATRGKLPQSFATRRLCQVQVVGMKEPVELYELHGETADGPWLARRDGYEEALGLFEDSRWAECCQRLAPLLKEGSSEDASAGEASSTDPPSQLLFDRASRCAKSPPDSFNPVFNLDSK